MRRAEAARSLGIRKSELQRLEAAGLARPRKDRHGWADYDEDELSRVVDEVLSFIEGAGEPVPDGEPGYVDRALDAGFIA